MNFKNTNTEIKFEIDTDDFQWRTILIYLLLVAVFLYLLFGAFELQIVKGQQSFQIAKRTNQYQVKTLAPRGLILSSDGMKLAYNSPGYSLTLNSKELSKEEEDQVLTLIAKILDIDNVIFITDSKSKIYDESGNRIASDRITLKSDINYDQYYLLLSRIEELKGIHLIVEPKRTYSDPIAFSNVIGYLGDPTQKDIESGIYSESQIGKTGIEGYYDNYLRGKEGLSVVEKEVVSGEFIDYDAYQSIPGNNVYLTIDSRWQKSLSEILNKSVSNVKAFGGAGVIVNSRTGEVKAMVTNPGYDNNLFANGISYGDYQSLINDPKKPLFNRPISLQLPPGSIMKIVAATAGLESGVISESEKKLSDRCIDLPGNIKFCEADRGYIGWVNVEEAMARSSNIFFCLVMQDMRAKNIGYEYYYDIAKNYGLGNKTGIDLWGEVAGTIPNADYKMATVKQPWYIGDECNTVIGQGYVTVTPLQMAMLVSTVMNNGELIKPHILSKVVDQTGSLVFERTPEQVRSLHVSDETIRILKEGLQLGVQAGTAGGLKGLPGNPGAKTGSSDAGEWINGTYYDGAHSWIMGCFDYENENYCFTVMQQWGGRGYKTVPIMKKFINCLYNNFSSNCSNI